MMRDVPRKYRRLYEKRKTSRKAAIRFDCLECMGFSEKRSDLTVLSAWASRRTKWRDVLIQAARSTSGG
jgi:hypothetical protein